MRVGFLRVSFCCCVLFPLSFRADQMPKRWCVWCSFLFFLSRGEKTSADSRKSLRAHRALGRRERCDQNARAKKHNVASRTFSFERIRCAQGVFVCACVVRAPKSSQRESARAHLAEKTFVGRMFPLTPLKKKEKKISQAFFAPFFCPLCSFFSFFGLVFLFFGKKEGKFLSHSLGSWFFQVYYQQHAIMDSSLYV